MKKKINNPFITDSELELLYVAKFPHGCNALKLVFQEDLKLYRFVPVYFSPFYKVNICKTIGKFMNLFKSYSMQNIFPDTVETFEHFIAAIGYENIHQFLRQNPHMIYFFVKIIISKPEQLWINHLELYLK